MNEQNSDSFSPEATPSLPEISKTPVISTKKHASVLDILSGFWHKQGSEKLSGKETTPAVEVVTDVAPVENISQTPQSPPSVVEKSHLSITGKISHIFHKKVVDNTPNTGIEIVEKTDSLAPNKEPETPFAIDERFARLLEQDTTYHSMIRSEDIKNIQLQLSMRYMLLMLAIFVVIAWVVNNRVIMFGFSDFPLLARTRDGLFAILTGLFSLTVWFGAGVWLHHRVGMIMLRVFGIVLFLAVLVSIYLPFWR